MKNFMELPGVASDVTIKKLCSLYGMINPFVPKSINQVNGKRIVSYGLSSYGYDIRLKPKFVLFSQPNDGRVIDVLEEAEPEAYGHTVEAESIVVPPGGFILASTVEEFSMPDNVVGICFGKSTWARCGAIVNVTPLEPGWKGELVVEITNGTNLPLRIYANMGIAQIMFFRGDVPCEVSYADRKGKYQNQTGIQQSILFKEETENA